MPMVDTAHRTDQVRTALKVLTAFSVLRAHMTSRADNDRTYG
jgi:hypothetical protein